MTRSTMMKSSLLTLCAFGVVTCSGNAATPPREPGRTVVSLREIAGPWDIVSFDGYAPRRLHEGLRRAYVDVGPKSLTYVIECNSSGNPARIDGAGVLHKLGDEPQIQTLMGCGPEREARDAAFFGFFVSRPKVTWSEGGRLRLFNGRTTLVLERPDVRRLANIPPLREIIGRWVPQTATRMLDGNGYEGRGFQQPYPVNIEKNTITYRGCGGVTFNFQYTADARMKIVRAQAKTDCGFDEPGTALVRVLRSGPLVERTAEGGIALTAGNEVISLRTEAEVRR